MRLVKVNTPEGRGADVAHLALDVGIAQASVHQQHTYGQAGRVEVKDTVEVEASTPLARAFVDSLMSADFYDPKEYSLSVRQPRSIASKISDRKVTWPVLAPTVDILEELWQFSHVTYSFVLRVAFASLLVAYGMIEDKLLVMIAGLLFLPLLPVLEAIGFGLWTRNWRLAGQGVFAFAVAAMMLVGAGAVLALVLQPPLRFQEFSPLLTSFLISLGVGVTAGLAAADDVGRRELIALAATAQTALLPAWFGIRLVYGPATGDMDPPSERVLVYAVNVVTIVAAALATFAATGMRTSAVQRYAQGASESA
jgi:hypothetical protein